MPALGVEELHRIVKGLNRTVRAGALSVNQAVTWLSGFPLRTRLAYDSPLDHDAHRYRTERLLRARQIDALLWISSFAPEAFPDSLDEDVPLIVLGHAATRFVSRRKGPTVFVPVSTPGIDHDLHLFRVDASVVAPLSAARTSNLPSVADIARELAKRRSTSLSVARLRGGTLYDPANGIDGEKRDTHMRDGRIVSYDEVRNERIVTERDFDASSMIVIAGGIDLHSHRRWQDESIAAVAA